MNDNCHIEGIDYRAWITLNHENELRKAVSREIIDWNSDIEIVKFRTSGSTGKPKLILIQKNYIRHSVEVTGELFKLKKGDRSLLCLPVGFVGGRMMLYRSLVLGLNLKISNPQVTDILKQEGQFKFCAMTPLQVSKIAEKEPSFFNKIETLITGGGRIDNVLESKLLHLKTKCYATFGMTETISHIALRKLNHGFEKTFMALPGVFFKVNSNDQLIINAPQWGVNNLTTNDVVTLVSDTEFIWKGRIDNVINSGGYKLFPEKIESELVSRISENFFIDKLPDSVLGSKVVLFVEGDEREINLDSLQKLEKPKEIFFIPKFKYTNSGKIDRIGTVNLL